VRLLHIYAGPFPTVQGTQALVGQTLSMLADAGHEVHLLCYSNGDVLKSDKYTVHRIPDFPRYISRRSGPSWRKVALDISLAVSCRKLTLEIAPDIVHAHHYEALIAARMADPRRIHPLVFHSHALLGPELPTYFITALQHFAGLIGKILDRNGPMLADGVVALSSTIESNVLDAGFDRSRVVLARPPALPLCTDKKGSPESSFFSDSRLLFLYSGNLDKYQGIDNLLRAITELDRETLKLIHLEFVASSQVDELRRQTERLGLKNAVSVVPHGTPDDAWIRMTRADVVIIPRSSSGGFPIKLVNALTCGCPTLIDRNIAPELNHGREVWMTDMTQPSTVAAAIKLLINNKELRVELAAGAKEAAKRLHSPDKMLRSLESLYSSLLCPLIK
jgi:glycosyltransferase involved in cell wall biosynthesis